MSSRCTKKKCNFRSPKILSIHCETTENKSRQFSRVKSRKICKNIPVNSQFCTVTFSTAVPFFIDSIRSIPPLRSKPFAFIYAFANRFVLPFTRSKYVILCSLRRFWQYDSSAALPKYWSPVVPLFINLSCNFPIISIYWLYFYTSRF